MPQTNSPMSTVHRKSEYPSWAEGFDMKEGSSTEYHSYTHKDSKFDIDEYGRVIYTNGQELSKAKNKFK